jgi:hypothetical protein
MGEKSPESAGSADPDLAGALDLIRKALRGVQFGEVKVIIQDSVVVQVERTERMRPPGTKSKRSGTK